MTDAETSPDVPEAPQESSSDEATRDDIRPKDWMLDELVRIFDHDGSAIGITLQSNGATISGLLIGADEYLRRVGEAFEKSPVPDMKLLPELWAKSLANGAEFNDEREAKGLPRLARRYLHMREVRIFSGSVYLDLDLWRGSLEDVTGWSLGNVTRG